MTDEPLPGRIVGNSILLKDLEISEVHDHLCLLYDSTLDWRTFVASYIKTGLECGERCCYIYDTHTARQIRDLLRADNVDVTALEASGQLNIIHGHKTYFKNGYFDPDFLISSYVVETEKAVSQGCPGLRITFETDWVEETIAGIDIPHAHIHLMPINNADDINFTNDKLSLSSDELKTIQQSILGNLVK